MKIPSHQVIPCQNIRFPISKVLILQIVDSSEIIEVSSTDQPFRPGDLHCHISFSANIDGV